MTMRLPKPILFRQGEETASLLSLIEQYEKGVLKAPPHQRDFVWKQEKIVAWWENLVLSTEGEVTEQPIGYMATYQLRATGDYFLNDGWQRLNATMLFLSEGYKRFKLSEEEARLVVQGYKLIVSHRVYDRRTQAMYWCQVIQLTTPMSPYDFCRGYLAYTEDDTDWLPTAQELHTFMGTIIPASRGQGGIAAKMQGANAPLRHNYALFLRWLTKRSLLRPSHASVSSSTLSLTDAKRGRMVESQLADEFVRRGIEDVTNELRLFKKFIKAEIAKIDTAVELNPTAKTIKLAPTTYRFLLGVSLWRHNNKLDHDENWSTFLTLFFLNMEASSRLQFTRSDGSVSLVVLGAESQDKLTQITREIGHTPYFNFLMQNRGI